MPFPAPQFAFRVRPLGRSVNDASGYAKYGDGYLKAKPIELEKLIIELSFD